MAITISGENNNDRILAQDGVIDQISGINIVGLITASHINVGSNIQLGNAGIITATTFVGNVTGNVNSTSPLLLQTGGSERFRITSDNALGIAGANYGSSGQVLTSGGSGSAVSWTTPTVTTISGNANNRIITGSGTANTLNGESTFTYDGDGLLSMTSTSGSAEFTIVGPSNTDSGIYFNDGANDGAISYDHSNRQLKFRAGGHTRMYFAGGNDSNNNVIYLVNNSYDDGILQYYNGGIYLKTGSSNGDRVISFSTAGSPRLTITSSGKIEVKGTRAGSLQASDDDTLQLYTASTNNNIDRGAGITFYNHDNSGYEMGGTIQVAKENGTADNVAAYMRFSTRPAGGSATERLRIASDGVATFAATNINVNRNAGDAFISLQTSGTSNVALYGGASTGFRVFTKPSGGSLTDRLIIDPDGAAFFKGVSAGAKGTINLESQDPFIRLYDTNGATDRRKWDIRNIGASGYEELDFRTINDANNSFNSVMQIEYGGDVNINDGNLRVANGHGIDFSATGDSAGNQGSSELFDDYEEGTWTPAFKAGNNSTACPTSVSEASYTRVGRLVTATAYFTLTSYASGTTGGDTRIVGLPYTGIGQHGGVSINYWWGLKQNVNFMAGTVQGNTSEILIRATTSAAVGTANIDFDNTFESGDSLILTATYFTS